jgi:formylglycine-generating enzyme required for sulfatase activity
VLFDTVNATNTDEYGIYATHTLKSPKKAVSFNMRWIPPGEFQMGSPEDEAERRDNETQHSVTLTKGLWLAETACTQALWESVMGQNPSKTKNLDHPVTEVSWNDIEKFLKKLVESDGEGWRLPTEAEWEYACRAGTTTRYSFGDTIDKKQANFFGRSGTVPVKQYPCNPWGLYEMHGNVLECCSDWYGDYSSGAVVDTTGPERGVLRVLRGGSWNGVARGCRSALRFRSHPDDRLGHYGFRLARGPITSKTQYKKTR